MKDLSSYFIVPREGSELLVARERTHLDTSWDNCYYGLLTSGFHMPTIKDLVARLNHLKTGQVLDGNRTPIDPMPILEEHLAVRPPYRGEWLGARFIALKKEMYIIYHKEENGIRREVIEPLVDCLMEDKQISLEYWLQNATSQGLPPTATPNGDLFYFSPRNGRVAGFAADSDKAGLYCDGGSKGSDPGLGVRSQIFLKSN